MPPLSSRRIAGPLLAVVVVLLGLVVALLAPFSSGSPGTPDVAAPEAGEPGSRPNIVLVTTDDMTVTDLRWMPVTRRLLGREGTSFDRALSPHPLCCPARAAILTGQYAQNNGVKGNQAPYHFDALDTATTLPVWLAEAGYRTGFTGKYLNGFGMDGERQPGWEHWDPTMIGHYAYTPFQMYDDGRRTWHRDVNNVDYVNRRTTDLVRGWAGDDAPFFIWASHVAPHGRLDEANGIPSTAMALPPARFAEQFANVQSPSLEDPGYTDDDVSDANGLVRSKNLPGRDKINQIFRSRIRSLQAVDEGIGQLVRTLRQTGELDDTVIVFTSDNGFLMGEHHLVTKNVPYRQSLRVPLLVRGPGVPAGQRLDQRALMIDLAPTFADLAGVEPLVPVDGVSLLPALREDAPLRSTVLIQAGPTKRVEQGEEAWWWRGVTTDRYTYALFHGDGFEELYDRWQDPAENTNLADHPEYREVLAEMRRRTALLVRCSGATECSRRFGPDPEPGQPVGLGGLPFSRR